MCLCTPEENVGSPELYYMGAAKHGSWEPNAGLLEDQQVFISSELSLQALELVF